ncbi:AMP-binding protein [Shimia aestuarii]|uniref:AMP-binding protein n=1 Tax=Shimia aestuarii TaxID=254406 RepID=UPI001FB3C1D7|nr:AMP-binding protein [Shimia aestuarii]
MQSSIGAFFKEKSEHYRKNEFLAVPADAGRAYHPDGYAISYEEAGQLVQRWQDRLQRAGYGFGDRVAVLLGNRPEMMLLKLALNGLGMSWVPVNPDYRPNEVAYLLDDSRASLAIAAPELAALMRDGIAEAARDVAMVEMSEDLPDLPQGTGGAEGVIDGSTEASLIYTSGTTGRPKGCILSHAYELDMGRWYATRGGLIDFRDGQDRIYNPLPLFHVNAGIITFYCAIDKGNCQIIPERFRANSWWRELSETGATVVHYLGIVIPALMNLPESPWDHTHKVRFAVGAGVEPTLHRPFEERFGFPLIEVWGMTEMCRILGDNHEPRQIDTRAMGRPSPGLEVRVVDQDDNEVPRGTPGEMTLRYSAEEPRRGFFSGYLNLPEATEEAWKGGWFHTGDTVVMDESGMVFFVDRKKNIIRRSGENIAAAEIEACLQEHPKVERVAVLAVEDAMRDEEVMACVTVTGTTDAAMADDLFAWCFKRLAYYKAPGWIRFVDEIPVTGTQKIQKHAMFSEGQDPTEGAHDFRPRKKRG